MCEKSIESILRDVNRIIDHNVTELRESGACFNLLEISGINRLEVKMCRILAELLNPSGSHYQNILFLKGFMKDVLKIEIEDEELQQAQVLTEYTTECNRRIDIVIITSQWFIPIEVKLHAKDQKKQCLDYFNFAKSTGGAGKVYYLTLDGHLPYENEGLTPIVADNEIVGYEEIAPLSFANDVCKWLAEIAQKIIDKPVLYTSIIQFKEALENLGGRMNKGINTEIAELISETSDSFRSALSISESVNIAKENLLRKIFEILEKEMSWFGRMFQQLHNHHDYKYNDHYAIHNYYKKKTFPALIYEYKKIDDNKDIWFVIELGAWGDLYCGFVLAENGENPKELLLSDEELKRHFKNLPTLNKEDWWFYWRYLSVHPGESMLDADPNFKDLNEAYLSLYDTDNLKKYIDNVISVIYMMLHDVIGMSMIDQCKRNTMPQETDSFILERNFSETEIKILQQGHIPNGMEDKWCGYFENGALYIHRSWSKYSIYIIKFNSHTHCHEVVVNRNKQQCLRTDTEKDIDSVNYILNHWLMWSNYND